MFSFRGWGLGVQSFLLAAGLCVSLVSSSALGVWLGVELKMFSALPILLRFKKTSLVYFVVQSIGTSFFLVGLMAPHFSFFLVLALLMKLGLFPFYSWYLSILQNLPLWVIWVLATAQKIHLLCLVSKLSSNAGMAGLSLGMIGGILAGVHLLVTLSKHWGSIKSMNKQAMGFLSILDTSVLVIIFLAWPLSGLVYFLGYSVFLGCFVNSLKSLGSYSISLMVFVVSVLNLGGFPPTPGFFFKMNLLGLFSCLPTLTVNFGFLEFVLVLGLTFILLVQFIGYLVLFLGHLVEVYFDSNRSMGLWVLLIGWLCAGSVFVV